MHHALLTCQSDGTVPLDEEYLPTVFQDGREYQQFALHNFHYFEPMDDVRLPSPGLWEWALEGC